MDKYKLLISELAPFLKALSYKKSGQDFFHNQDGNIGVINFQKSQSSTSSSILFTINLGVYSAALKMLDSIEVKSKPTISDCHWRKRIGLLMPGQKDYWWNIDDTHSVTTLRSEISAILTERAIPEIEKHISDDALEKSWLNGECNGITEPQMYLYLIGLLKRHGNSAVLQHTIAELMEKSKGKPYFSNIKENLLKLGIGHV